ncbi:hypothetical protein D3C84_1144580 [compost metagenome]
MAVGQILLRQVGAAGHQAAVKVVIGNGLEQGVELGNTQALATEGLEQRLTVIG